MKSVCFSFELFFFFPFLSLSSPKLCLSVSLCLCVRHSQRLTSFGENGCCQDVWECVHSRVDRSMVLLQHWSVAVEQVFVEQLWIQIPHLLDHVPHDGMCIVQLHSNRVDEDSSDASHQIANPVCEDLGIECDFLYLGGEWQHLTAVSACVFQPSHRRHNSLLHSCVCLCDDIQT